MIDFSGVSNQSWPGRFFRSFLRWIPDDRVMKVMQGPLRGMRWIAGASTHGCWLGSYELEKQRLIAGQVSPGSVFFDVGANVGFYTLLGSSEVGTSGRVISFEPLPLNIEYLERHIELNGLNNVTVIKAAVSDQAGEGQFDEGQDNCMGKLSSSGTIKVEMVALDDLIEQGKVPIPDFVKIDVEGAEYSVLEGAQEMLRTSGPTVFLATHGSHVHQRCLDFLGSLGYHCQPIEKGASLENCDEIIAVKDACSAER